MGLVARSKHVDSTDVATTDVETTDVEATVPTGVVSIDLVTSVGHRTWLGRSRDGTPVVARWLAHRDEIHGSRRDRSAGAVVARAKQLTSVRLRRIVPVLGVGHHGDGLWLLSEEDRGISLRRLLQVATLTPEQAALIVSDVVKALADLHEAGYPHGDVHAGNVHIDRSGNVRLGDWAATALLPKKSHQRRRRMDAHDAASLGQQLQATAAAGRVHQRPAQARVLEALEKTRADLLAEARRGPKQSLSNIATRLTAVVSTGSDIAIVRQQLAALVAATPPAGSFFRPDQVGAAPVQTSPGAAPSAGGGRAPRPQRRRTVRRGLRWTLAAAVVLGLAAGAQWALVGDQITANLRQLIGGAEEAAPTPSPTAVEPPAPEPKPGDPISRINLRALAACEPGAVCPVSLIVEVQAKQSPQRVEWSYQVVDRCTGERTTWPGGAAVVVPGADRSLRVDQVPLPQGRSLELFAVTTSPVRATGESLVVAAEGDAC